MQLIQIPQSLCEVGVIITSMFQRHREADEPAQGHTAVNVKSSDWNPESLTPRVSGPIGPQIFPRSAVSLGYLWIIGSVSRKEFYTSGGGQ